LTLIFTTSFMSVSLKQMWRHRCRKYSSKPSSSCHSGRVIQYELTDRCVDSRSECGWCVGVGWPMGFVQLLCLKHVDYSDNEHTATQVSILGLQWDWGSQIHNYASALFHCRSLYYVVNLGFGRSKRRDFPNIPKRSRTGATSQSTTGETSSKTKSLSSVDGGTVEIVMMITVGRSRSLFINRSIHYEHIHYDNFYCISIVGQWRANRALIGTRRYKRD
jgi:hypothetical protein